MHLGCHKFFEHVSETYNFRTVINLQSLLKEADRMVLQVQMRRGEEGFRCSSRLICRYSRVSIAEVKRGVLCLGDDMREKERDDEYREPRRCCRSFVLPLQSIRFSLEDQTECRDR